MGSPPSPLVCAQSPLAVLALPPIAQGRFDMRWSQQRFVLAMHCIGRWPVAAHPHSDRTSLRPCTAECDCSRRTAPPVPGTNLETVRGQRALCAV